MTETMVERVAAAMETKRRELINQPLARVWDELSRAAIEAMRNFTDAMEQAGEKADNDFSEASPNRACFMIWNAMIDSALKE